MKKYFIPLSFIVLITLSGCRLREEAQAIYEEAKNAYEDARDEIERGPKPTIQHQSNESILSTIIAAECSSNQVPRYIYFSTQAAASNIFNAIKNLYSYPPQGILKPFWDSRYVNPVSEYVRGTDGSHYPNHATLTGLDARTGIRNIIVGTGASQVDSSGGVVQSECINGKVTAGTTINLHDAPEQYIVYSGPQSTFVYHIHPDNNIYPWKNNKTGNLMMQAYFDNPIYINFENNIGASVSYNIYLYNPKINKHINYVIGLYAAGEAWQREKAGIRFDPTTNIIHVGTVAKYKNTWWAELSLKSNQIKEIKSKPGATTKDNGKWNNLYRVNIAYQNLLQVLQELKANPPAAVAGQDFGLSPEDWKITLVGIQYELEEQGGKALLSGSFSGFNVATSNYPF